MEHSYEYTMLYPDQIKKDPKYQREIDIARIKKITKNWDDDLVNAPKVSLRENGVYYVFNGQHTLAAWKKRYGNRPIQCKVYRGLTEVEEKDLFVKQEGFSKAVGLVDKLRAEFNSGDPDVTDMVSCIRIAGCSIDFDNRTSNAQNRINAVSTAFNVYKEVGHDNFINIIDILRRSFYGDYKGFQDGFLKGMKYLFKHHCEKISIKQMVTSLQKQPADYYVQQANRLEGSAQVRYAKAFATQYNKGRRVNRIDLDE